MVVLGNRSKLNSRILYLNFYSINSAYGVPLTESLKKIVNQAYAQNQIISFLINTGGYINGGIGYITADKLYGHAMVFGYDYVLNFSFVNGSWTQQ